MPLLSASVMRTGRMRNQMQTWLLAGGSLVLLGATAAVFAGVPGLVSALIAGGISIYLTTHLSPALILRLYKARPIEAGEFADGVQLASALAVRAGLPAAPRLWLVHSRMMNAFAVGRPDDAALVVTDGLLRGLTLRELAGVLAHEISHIANEDVKVMALADMVSRMTSVMSTLGILTLIINLPAIFTGSATVPWLGVALLVAAPTVGGLLQLALSRTREYDADLSAVALTDDPSGLASALAKLEQAQRRLWEGLVLPGGRLPDPSLLRTHPATEERIARLEALATESRQGRYDDRPVVVGKSIVPAVGRPRVRVRSLGLWY
ncbi:MAG: zinc metalloprotease HtpX [Hyphomicrobiales bacterium]